MLDVVLLEGVEWSFILRRIKIAPKRRHQNSMPEKEKRKGNISRKRRKKRERKKSFFFLYVFQNRQLSVSITDLVVQAYLYCISQSNASQLLS